MHRFHVSPGILKTGLVTLNKNESHHALSVLRLKPGAVVELLDGRGGVFQGIVAGAQKGRVTVSVRSDPLPKRTGPVQITLAVSVIKPERMELLIQKACELGAGSIVPLITERTIVHLSPERWEAKLRRWRKIAAESCKQCGQPVLPAVRNVMPYKKFVPSIAQYDLCLIATLAAGVKSLDSSLNAHSSAQSVLILIGPEGDFSKNEASLAVQNGALCVTLGALVMRSETAAMYLLSVLAFFYGQKVSQDGKA